MASETITVCENICRDFSWFFDAVSSLASNPVWALVVGGGISLMIWRSQTNLSFRLVVEQEKRKLFMQFLELSEPARQEVLEHQSKTAKLNLDELPQSRALYSVADQINLIARKQTRQAVKDLLLCTLAQSVSDDRELFLGAKNKCIEEMRMELKK